MKLHIGLDHRGHFPAFATLTEGRYHDVPVGRAFDFPKGSIVSIIGPNGAGKTTFFNCITGFYTFDEGTLTFDGHNLKGLSTYQITRLGIARTFQNIRLFNNMTAIENIMVGQESHLKSTWLGAVFGTKTTRQENA